jgi:hypothetical protein
MKEIGGYPEFELNKGKEYHTDAIKLNSGRNALWYILKTYFPQKIFLPYYICDSVLEPIKRMKIEFEFYPINEEFEPILPSKMDKEDFVLYVNYFGICDTNVKKLASKYSNLITDNSQAFFCQPYKDPTFYSPRKFFGVPDGAYLFTKNHLNEELEKAHSYDKCTHLLKRFDLGSQEGYSDYKIVEESFSDEPIKTMSNLTQQILASIDYNSVKSIRERNFQFIHKNLKNLNELKIDINNVSGPMKYPFLIRREGVKQFLIKKSIFISTYWKEVLERVDINSFEYDLITYLNPLPIDQRYNIDDMKVVIEKINEVVET